MWIYIHRFVLWLPVGSLGAYAAFIGLLAAATQAKDAYATAWLSGQSAMLNAVISAEYLPLWIFAVIALWLAMFLFSGHMVAKGGAKMAAKIPFGDALEIARGRLASHDPFNDNGLPNTVAALIPYAKRLAAHMRIFDKSGAQVHDIDRISTIRDLFIHGDDLEPTLRQWQAEIEARAEKGKMIDFDIQGADVVFDDVRQFGPTDPRWNPLKMRGGSLKSSGHRIVRLPGSTKP